MQMLLTFNRINAHTDNKIHILIHPFMTIRYIVLFLIIAIAMRKAVKLAETSEKENLYMFFCGVICVFSQ